jgi:pyrimidine-specific ribonucleoside hydrolase
MPTPVVLDCDPGHDDAIALALAAAAPAIELRAVTTVAGNQTLEKTTYNALRVLTVLDRSEVPVAPGLAEPLLREPIAAGEVHGETGLDGADLPEPAAEASDEHAVDAIARIAREATEPVTLVAVGPLSNVAVAIRRYPDLVDALERIVVMGGSLGTGNVTPAAEFNVHVDPEAAAIVFDAAVPVTMVGLNVTQAARLPADRFDELRAIGNDVATMVADLLDFYHEFHRERYGWESVPLHDALAVAHVARPGTLETEPMAVDVETTGEHTLGATVCDRWGVTDRTPNADVALDVDTDAFLDRLVDGIASY